MNFEELLKKYQAVLVENNNLKIEINNLKAQLGIVEQHYVTDKVYKQKSIAKVLKQEPVNKVLLSGMNIYATPIEKIKLFMSLFKGREDVYAKRWESKKKVKNGYSPVCLNEWKSGVCSKPKIKCDHCIKKAYAALDEKVIEEHLKGNIVVGIYPLCLDETCYFLAIDFDDEGWQKDISVLREVCMEYNIPVAVERSCSGNGAHAWFFFENKISAVLARKLGTALLTYSMSKRHEITFESYDRFFPSQDTLPKGGLGNLIALPLQKAARKYNNSVFIDENLEPYADQWGFLAAIKKLSEYDIEMLISKLYHGNELGVLKKDDEDDQKPWETAEIKLTKNDFPADLKVVKANMLFIEKSGISQRALNYIKRLAAFKNPEFYKAQAMRMSTFKKPRIISCADEVGKYLCLPRGCEVDLIAVLKELEIAASWIDNTNCGRNIDVEFNGSLRDEQLLAINELLKYDNGVLSGTTAFGKTVVSIKLIAERKVNTLILVDRVSLVSQWKNKLAEFLSINELLPEMNQTKKRGRKKAESFIGQIGAGKDSLGGIIDIAVMQSLNRMGEVKDCVKNYGMVIVDECHHISAFSFEKILKNTNAKYVYGLTATPTRKDGHHPIIFMQCGPIRYRDNAKKQAEKRPFEHFIIPRFTPLRVPLDKNERDVSIQELYSEIVVNEMRNQLIVDDVVRSFENNRNCIVLTQRTAHVELLAKKLSERIPNVISLTGGMGRKHTREILTKIAETPTDKQLILIATGKYIGEGFDEPRLDTLFLAMPISWKGTLQQYAGRLHRLYENKNEVQIYDYVDIHVRMLEKMYHKRLTGYASIGYKAKGESIAADSIDIIFDKSDFLPVFSNDLVNAGREILIVSPFVTKRRTLQMLQYLDAALRKKIRVIVVTRPVEDSRNKDKSALKNVLDSMKSAGISLILKSDIHQKFAVVDQRIVWYGSINLLSFGSAEESIMRLDSPNISHGLLRRLEI
ncbi:type III restriction protein res subunit [Desulfofarcimen acetoxidans DSM 771]|uniref:Type III restriction protein res subunit n=1 Tax=Desulfofarcimen acetoxidans (strain ATCC 49208 / DSM 771 / KCTC 5769 / VKM B-1644 / 5575) TaxID=485916 RepID=C8VVK9_DESAS|nr:DEAD/DEAH box helicase family protein [Desulfofarcimen acetoxidans]ACV62324.1 type III restriction protein res subunit [Desulfofarcimen acetoxidans DSM 771]